ncbi:MAG: nitrile hydratase subunit beta [Dehalococcoidia bacterium]
MNGAHDMGGMEGFGPIQAEPESKEPVFHSEAEARVFAMNRAAGIFHLWNIDISRYAKERQHPADYLKHSYYENWLAGLETLLVEAGLVTPEELTTGKVLSPVSQEIKDAALKAEQVGTRPLRVTNYRREVEDGPRYQAGDRIRALNRHPTGHTREPRYIRGHVGTVHEHYGAQVYPDLSTQGIDEGRHLYAVRFEGRELWGESANANSVVYVDMFEDYMEPAE